MNGVYNIARKYAIHVTQILLDHAHVVSTIHTHTLTHIHDDDDDDNDNDYTDEGTHNFCVYYIFILVFSVGTVKIHLSEVLKFYLNSAQLCSTALTITLTPSAHIHIGIG